MTGREPMTCRDFEALWHERLDARDKPSEAISSALQSHLSSCAACRELDGRFRNLQHALAAWGPPPAAPAGFAARVLERWEPRVIPAGRGSIGLPRAVRWSVAAAVLLTGALAFQMTRPRKGAAPLARPAPEVAASRPLSAALADATSASLALARQTSAPAARIGRDVFATASVPADGGLALPGQVASPADLWQAVGDGVDRGVRPLSGSTRRAFSFLMSPSAANAVPATGPEPDA